MNSKILVLGAVISTLAGSMFATEAVLSPRAQGNQIKVVAAAPEAATVASPATLLTPRAAGSEIKVVKGFATDRNPALDCIGSMNGTPKAVGACSQSVTMPGCAKLAAN